MAAARHGSMVFPIARAFVVHFARERGDRRRFIGRVEHLASGRVKHFSSLRELLAFLDAAPDAPGPSSVESRPLPVRSRRSRRAR